MTTGFKPNAPFDRIFLLKGIDERRTKAGKPYLTVILGTSEGTWDGRVWDMEMNSLPGLLEGDPVQVKGSAQLYQEKIQLIVEDISKVDQPVDPRSLYPATSASEKQLRGEFNDFVDGIEEPRLKKLMEAMLEDRAFSDAFFTCPAAISMHHARIGGLAEHSINVCRLAHASVIVAPWLKRDLLTVGALLHDAGKVLEYEVAGDFRYTLVGKFQGHIVQGHSLVEKWIRRIPEFPERLALDVLHIILSHHGQLEYGSPKAPVTAEALVIHFADDLDAKLDMVKSAGEEPGTEEAFVRGLRRSFQYRSELEKVESEKWKDEQGESTFTKASADKGRMALGEEEQSEDEPSERASGREGEGEEEQDTGTRGRGDTVKTDAQAQDTESRSHPSASSGQAGKKKGQEELF